MNRSRHTRKRDSSEDSSCTIQQGALMAVLFLAMALTLQATQPGWWTASGGPLNSNPANDYAAANQGQLKRFTQKTVWYMDTNLPGGAGTALDGMVAGWSNYYATNHYSSTNPALADFKAVNAGQLKYIGSLIYGQLSSAGYTGLYPSWIAVNTNTDYMVVNAGQLKTAFNFDLSTVPSPVTGLTASNSNPGEIDLSWTLPTLNTATSVLIERSFDGGSTWTTLGTVIDPTITSYVDMYTSAPPGAALYRVSLVNPVGASTPAVLPAAIEPLPPIPPVPTNLTGTVDISGNMNLTWTASTGATSYTVERETIATGTWSTLGTATGTTAYQDVVSSYGSGGYHYRVSAVNSTGTSTPSIEFPQSRYAVIDLGANVTPISLSNTGYVLAETLLGYSRWYNGTSQPLTAGSYPGIDTMTGIDDNGNAVGQLDVYTAPLSRDNPNPSDVAAVWPVYSTTPIPLLYQTFGPNPSDNPVFMTRPTVMDYNGTIYGTSLESSLYSYEQDYQLNLGVEWNNSTSLDTAFNTPELQSYPGYPASDGDNLQYEVNPITTVVAAKNNHIAEVTSNFQGLLPPSEEPGYGMPTYTVDGQSVIFQPIDVNTVGDAIGYLLGSSPTTCIYLANGTISNLPATSVVAINHAMRNQHNPDGSVTPVECPQVLGGNAHSDIVLDQYNPDTGNYEELPLNNLLPENAGWSSLAVNPAGSFPFHPSGSYPINDSGAIVGTATLTTTVGGTTTTTSHGVMLITPAPVFKLRDDSTVFQGWDGASSSSDGNAWTVVPTPTGTTTHTNSLVKLVLPPNAQNLGLECVVDDTDSGYSAGCISMAAVTLTSGDNNINITGIAQTTATSINSGNYTTSQPARIVLRQQSTKQVLCVLNVIVQPPVNITVDIFYAFDTANSHSMLPSGFPQSATDTTTAASCSANILSNINSYFNSQANVLFTLGNSYILTSFTAGNPFDATTGLINFNPSNLYSGGMGYLAQSGASVDSATTHIRLFVAKGYNGQTSSFTYLALSRKPNSFVPALTNLSEFYLVCGHEIGRDLDLSSVDTADPWQLDPGPWPIEFGDDGFEGNLANQVGLLSWHLATRGTPWIRHEDSLEGNKYAATSSFYH